MALGPVLVIGGMFSLCANGILAILAGKVSRILNSGRDVGDGPVNAFLLNHHALLIPLAVWQAIAVMKSLGHPAFGLLEPKPALWTSHLVQYLGSWKGGLWLLGLYGLNLAGALRLLSWRRT